MSDAERIAHIQEVNAAGGIHNYDDIVWLLARLKAKDAVVEALGRVSVLQDKVLDARDALMACGGIRDANYWAWHDVHVNASGELLAARQALHAHDAGVDGPTESKKPIEGEGGKE